MLGALKKKGSRRKFHYDPRFVLLLLLFIIICSFPKGWSNLFIYLSSSLRQHQVLRRAKFRHSFESICTYDTIEIHADGFSANTAVLAEATEVFSSDEGWHASAGNLWYSAALYLGWLE